MVLLLLSILFAGAGRNKGGTLRSYLCGVPDMEGPVNEQTGLRVFKSFVRVCARVCIVTRVGNCVVKLDVQVPCAMIHNRQRFASTGTDAAIGFSIVERFSPIFDCRLAL